MTGVSAQCGEGSPLTVSRARRGLARAGLRARGRGRRRPKSLLERALLNERDEPRGGAGRARRQPLRRGGADAEDRDRRLRRRRRRLLAAPPAARPPLPRDGAERGLGLLPRAGGVAAPASAWSQALGEGRAGLLTGRRGREGTERGGEDGAGSDRGRQGRGRNGESRGQTEPSREERDGGRRLAQQRERREDRRKADQRRNQRGRRGKSGQVGWGREGEGAFTGPGPGACQGRASHTRFHAPAPASASPGCPPSGLNSAAHAGSRHAEHKRTGRWGLGGADREGHPRTGWWGLALPPPSTGWEDPGREKRGRSTGRPGQGQPHPRPKAAQRVGVGVGVWDEGAHITQMGWGAGAGTTELKTEPKKGRKNRNLKKKNPQMSLDAKNQKQCLNSGN